MLPAAFVREIGGPGRKPLYVLAGGEPSAVARCLSAAREAVDENFRDFNYQVLDLAAGEAGRLIGEASTGAFFTPPRVVVAKNPAFLADDWAALADYLDDPSENSIILILDKVDARLRFTRKIQAGDMDVDCQPPKGAGLVKWLSEEFRARGVAAPPAVCSLIIERAGSDLGVLGGEAEKLSLYLGDGGRLTAEVVRDLVGLAPGGNIFELGDALGRRDARAALPILLNLLATEHHLPVLAMMARHFRILMLVKTRQASRGTARLAREEAPSLGLAPFVLEKTQGQAAAWAWPDLIRALAALEDAHRTLVTTATDPRSVLENLALALTNRSA